MSEDKQEALPGVDGEGATVTAPGKSKIPPKAKPPIRENAVGHAGEKVVVMCKVPNGVVIRAFRFHDEDVPVFGGGVKVQKVARPTGDQLVIHGPAHPFGEAPKTLIVHGYAMNVGVDRDLWDTWFVDNKNSDLIKKHQIAALKDTTDAEAWAAEHANVRSGLEGINSGQVKDKDGKERPADPRMPRGTPNITGTVTESIPGR